MKKILFTTFVATSMTLNALAANGDLPAAADAEVISQIAATNPKNIKEAESLSKIINWDKGANADIIVIGFGKKGSNYNRMQARRTATADAYRNLAETIGSVQIDASTTVNDLMSANDMVNAKVHALIKSAKITDEGEMSDGFYIKMAIPMFGKENSLAAATMPDMMKATLHQMPKKVSKKVTALDKQTYKEAKTLQYSGIVVDCRDLGLEYTYAPQILDSKGRGIYGYENVDINFAILNGMIEYCQDIDLVQSGKTRAGSNPLILKATAIGGGINRANSVNAVVSPEDGDRILLAMEVNNEIVRNSAVVFIK